MVKNKNFKRIISYFVTVLFITLILYLTRNQWNEFRKIIELNFRVIVLLSILFLLMQVLNGYILKLILDIFGIKLKFSEWFGLVSVEAFGNYLPLNAGSVYNAIYLKYKEELPLSQFMSCMIGQTVIMVLTYGIISIFLLIIRFFMNYNFNLIMFAISAAFVLFGLAVLILNVPEINSSSRILSWIKSVHNGYNLIKTHKTLIIKIIILQTITLIILSLRYVVVFNEFRYKIDIFAIIIITIMTSVIRFTSVFPGNLGVKEAISGSVTRTFGLMFNYGVIATIVIRLVAMFWIFLLGMSFSFVLLKKKGKEEKLNV